MTFDLPCKPPVFSLLPFAANRHRMSTRLQGEAAPPSAVGPHRHPARAPLQRSGRLHPQGVQGAGAASNQTGPQAKHSLLMQYRGGDVGLFSLLLQSWL